jgi:hypothetical protein
MTAQIQATKPSNPEHHKPLFKQTAKERVIFAYFREVGVCKFDDLIIDSDYGSLKFTEDYDDLPLTVRIWLSCSNWEVVRNLAKSLGCADIIYYTGFVDDREDGSVCAMPLIITDGETAVVLAPKWVKPTDFDVKLEA